jgi:hypothetical protein
MLARDLRNEIWLHGRGPVRYSILKQMEIDDPENGEAFGDIEPEKPFHRPAVLFAWEVQQ